MIFRKIRDLLISSLVLEIIAVVLAVVAFYKQRATFSDLTNDPFNTIIHNFGSDYVFLGLFGGFVLLTFIAFFLLPIIAACHYGTKLEEGFIDIKKTVILTTPASLVFLPLVVLAWPITLIIAIAKTDVLVKRNKELKKKDEKKPLVVTRPNVIDLTTNANEENNTNQTPNRPVFVGGIYRPGQASASSSGTVKVTRPATTSSIYIRKPSPSSNSSNGKI